MYLGQGLFHLIKSYKQSVKIVWPKINLAAKASLIKSIKSIDLLYSTPTKILAQGRNFARVYWVGVLGCPHSTPPQRAQVDLRL